MKYCDYGCGLPAKYKQTNGRWCCSPFYSQCPILKKKNSIGNKGRIKSENEKQKISKSLTGRKHTEETKRKISENHVNISGINHPMFGKLHSEETKKKIGKSNRGRTRSESFKINNRVNKIGKNNPMFGISRFREENPNWKGGISNQPYCLIFFDGEFRELIYNRDGKQCLNPCCSHKSSRIVIHHIDYNKKNCYPGNLICLCNSCNAMANKDRPWHTSWYKAIIYQRYQKGVL